MLWDIHTKIWNIHPKVWDIHTKAWDELFATEEKEF
jgi:hypothetical protein